MSKQECIPDTDSVTLDTLFNLLSHHRRRAVLAVLLENDRELTVNDLTKEIVAQGHEKPITDVSGDAVNQIYLSLYHNHIPELAESQLIEYDNQRKIVKPTETLEQIEPFLSQVTETDSVSQLFDDE